MENFKDLVQKRRSIRKFTDEEINKNPDTAFSRSEILNRVWSADVCVVDRTVDVNVARLRKKIGRYGNRIFTKQGFGYGFKTKD